MTLATGKPALVMAVGATVGGCIGANFSRRILRTDLLRYAITAFGLSMAALLFLR